MPSFSIFFIKSPSCPSVPHFNKNNNLYLYSLLLFALLLTHPVHVLSRYIFFCFTEVVVVPTAEILINFVSQLLTLAKY